MGLTKATYYLWKLFIGFVPNNIPTTALPGFGLMSVFSIFSAVYGVEDAFIFLQWSYEEFFMFLFGVEYSTASDIYGFFLLGILSLLFTALYTMVDRIRDSRRLKT